ncbi:hypothetical protein FHU28_002357 [Micromonospora echinospora]|uniref:Uncharacterized protein n=1 Tax=Micromonospora echinospora TaxID=1877 RepID=A0ABR6MAX2_MICEC|nr:hypothetical protein [Micromonospora echinospora]
MSVEGLRAIHTYIKRRDFFVNLQGRADAFERIS